VVNLPGTADQAWHARERPQAETAANDPGQAAAELAALFPSILNKPSRNQY
jgi:hypothetical protein